MCKATRCAVEGHRRHGAQGRVLRLTPRPEADLVGIGRRPPPASAGHAARRLRRRRWRRRPARPHSSTPLTWRDARRCRARAPRWRHGWRRRPPPAPGRAGAGGRSRAARPGPWCGRPGWCPAAGLPVAAVPTPPDSRRSRRLDRSSISCSRSRECGSGLAQHARAGVVPHALHRGLGGQAGDQRLVEPPPPAVIVGEHAEGLEHLAVLAGAGQIAALQHVVDRRRSDPRWPGPGGAARARHPRRSAG